MSKKLVGDLVGTRAFLVGDLVGHLVGHVAGTFVDIETRASRIF